MKKGFMVVQAGNVPLGRLEFDLYDDVVPRTVENFCSLLQEKETGKGFLNSSFHRIIRGFMAQGGDFTNGDGTGGRSIYGKAFADENFQLKHTRRGILSMANSGPNSNSSQFFICFRATPHLDNKHVVFGQVNLAKSEATLKKLEGVKTGREDRPISEITIVECGIIEEKQSAMQAEEDENEIDLEAEEEEEEEEEEEKKADDTAEIDLPEEEEEEDPPKTKAEEMRRRMRKLKMKMNQARQLNKQEVLKEGERLGSVEGAAKARKRQMMQDKKLKEAEWKSRNAKALEVAKGHGIDGKHLVEQADASLKKAYRKEEKAKANQFEMHDYHNPEGQHRNYERNLKSLVRTETEAAASADTYNPLIDTSVDQAKERNGARLLANEMKRRMDKAAKKKRERMDFEETDVSYINKRNKRFNEKINRTYDKHTAEIRQNLERGTAL